MDKYCNISGNVEEYVFFDQYIEDRELAQNIYVYLTQCKGYSLLLKHSGPACVFWELKHPLNQTEINLILDEEYGVLINNRSLSCHENLLLLSQEIIENVL